MAPPLLTIGRPARLDTAVSGRLRDRTFENGLICYPVAGNVDGHQGDIVILSPPYIASRSELDEIVDKLQRSLTEVMDPVSAARQA